MRRLNQVPTLVCFLLVLASACTAKATQEPQKELTGESQNWKVVVVSAQCKVPGEEDPWGTPGKPIESVYGYVREDRCLLFLHLHFEYKGPEGEVSAPRVTLRTEEGEEFSNYGNLSFSGSDPIMSRSGALDWLMSATHASAKEHKTIPLKTGDGFGNPSLGFLLDIPRDSKGLKLVFGGEEVSGLTINPTKSK